MSEIAERLRTDNAKMQELLKPIFKAKSFHVAEDNYPLLVSTAKEIEEMAQAIVMNGKYHYNGRTPWENGKLAAFETSGTMGPKVETLLHAVIAKGILVGKADIKIKGMTPEQREAFFKDPVRNQELEALVEELSADADLKHVLVEQVTSLLVNFCDVSGLAEYRGDKTLHIWDAWMAVIKTGSIGFYIHSIMIGRDDHVNDEFENLAALLGSM